MPAGEPGMCFPTNAEKQQNQIAAHECPVTEKGEFRNSPQIKEGIYPHDCLAEKAISIVC